jgi:hypothetical protein
MPNNNWNDYPVPKTADAAGLLPRVSCTTCEHEVAVSEAVVPEAADYVMYFCGLDCYERWRAQANG